MNDIDDDSTASGATVRLIVYDGPDGLVELLESIAQRRAMRVHPVRGGKLAIECPWGGSLDSILTGLVEFARECTQNPATGSFGQLDAEIFIGLFADKGTDYSIRAPTLSDLANLPVELVFDAYPQPDDEDNGPAAESDSTKWMRVATQDDHAASQLTPINDNSSELLTEYANNELRKLSKTIANGQTIEISLASRNGQLGFALEQDTLKQVSSRFDALSIQLLPAPL